MRKTKQVSISPQDPAEFSAITKLWWKAFKYWLQSRINVSTPLWMTITLFLLSSIGAVSIWNKLIAPQSAPVAITQNFGTGIPGPPEIVDPEPSEELVTYKAAASKKLRATKFQIVMWHIKAHESYRATKYSDGKYPSIGFGLNLHKGNREFAKQELADGKLTYNEAVKVTHRYLEEKVFPEIEKAYPNATDLQKAALALHKYNTGNIKTIRGCCGKTIGCGSRNSDIRSAHNRRRAYEWKLWCGQLTKADLDRDRLKAEALDRKNKSQP